jgi:hypothetical protein
MSGWSDSTVTARQGVPTVPGSTVARRLRTRCHAAALAKDKLPSRDAHFCTVTLLMKYNLVLNMALFTMH